MSWLTDDRHYIYWPAKHFTQFSMSDFFVCIGLFHSTHKRGRVSTATKIKHQIPAGPKLKCVSNVAQVLADKVMCQKILQTPDKKRRVE